MLVVPVLRNLRQESHEVKAVLDYMERYCWRERDWGRGRDKERLFDHFIDYIIFILDINPLSNR